MFVFAIVSETMAAFLVFLISFSLAAGFDYGQRCLLFNGTCVLHCPRLMHPYHTRCDRDTTSQRTCDAPFTYTIGFTCGWSRCDCNGDLILDENSQLCVKIGDCPIVRPRKLSRLGDGKKRKSHSRKKIEISDDTDLVDLI